MTTVDQNWLTARDPGEPLLLSGNEAIARAAIEAGVSFVTGYPGTPSTYVIESLMKLCGLGFRVEWAINEKVAFELATGVSWSGLRSMVTMKMSGLNVAADSFLSVQYSGARGGLVLYVADDPNVHYGMVEQDSRYYARLAAAPMLMPATPQEALDLTRIAFDLSEQIGRPVMVLGTTTLANTSERVVLREVKSVAREAAFGFDIGKYSKAGPRACIRQHQETLEALRTFTALTGELNPLVMKGERIGVIAAGVAWNYLREAMHIENLSPSILKLDVAHPLPVEKIKTLLSCVDSVLVLEELEPLIEESVRALLSEIDHPIKVVGKMDGTLSRTGDYQVECVGWALRKVYGRGMTISSAHLEETSSDKVKRLNTFCAGCPHRATYYALKQAIQELGYTREEVIITGDIGCTILGMNEPFRCCWTEISMGSSISVAQGFKYGGIKTPTIATIGDGTFFHAGIPALLNAAYHRVALTVIIFNNHWISMTGMQPHVGSEKAALSGNRQTIQIEEIVRAAGVRTVFKVNPFQTVKMKEVLKEAIASPELSVVISDAECALEKMRGRRKSALAVSPEKCVGLDVCRPSCIEALACPALERGEDGKAAIDSRTCTACGLCHHVCPQKAI